MADSNDPLEQEKNSPEQQGLFDDNLSGEDFLGYIIDNNDTLKLGRCKIKLIEKYDNLETQDIPWAYPICSPDFAGGASKGYGSFSFPKIGSLVRVRFNQGDIYHPEYYAVENMSDKLSSLISDSYTNAQVIRIDEDEDLQVFYTPAKGLMIWLKSSYINIDKSGDIFISHSGNTSESSYVGPVLTHKAADSVITSAPTINLDSPDCRLGTGAAHPAVKGDELMTLLMKMAVATDAKVPTTPGAVVAMVTSSDVLSSTVYVAD